MSNITTAHARVRQVEPDDAATAAFRGDIWEGLSQDPKRIPPKYFYDEHGLELFEAITRTPEYYLTRAELAILNDNAAAIASQIPPGAAMIEFGSGPTTKARILLQAAQIAAYVPVDICGPVLASEASRMESDFPGLKVVPVAADFTKPFDLPGAVAGMPVVGFFPGSTLGNFEAHEATAFLRHVARMLGPDARLIVGVDLVKEPELIHHAYNDASGITAAFNLNLLNRINRELDANFDIDGFRHCALYNRERHRVEMHLVSRVRQKVRVGGRGFDFRRGETIHTENSYKYTLEMVRTIAEGAGWRKAAVWLDPDQYFSVHVLICQEDAFIRD
jgi:dimethylhistidine N-methyltransferase